MSSKGRYKAIEWAEFEEIKGENEKKQKCRHCASKVSSKVERLRDHLKKCKEFLLRQQQDNDDLTLDENEIAMSTSSMASDFTSNCSGSLSSGLTPTKRPLLIQSLDKYIIKTTEAEKKNLDIQFAKLFYACNIPFNVIENNHMLKLVSLMRADSYKPPTRHDLSTYLLDTVYEECECNTIEELSGQNVTLLQDGWSNVHNHPIIASCLHNGKKSFFIRTVDAGSEEKTSDFMCETALKEIEFCESKYKCHVQSFCSDSENKMVLARRKLKEKVDERIDEKDNFLVYGCASHFLNLVENEISPKTVIKHIVEIQKYFRNHHRPGGWLREKKGLKPQIPNSTRWNSHDACIETFLKNYQKMREICMEHEVDIEQNIRKLLNNVSIYSEAINLQQQLRLISNALDTTQREDCDLGTTVNIWLKLLESQVLKPYYEILKKRFDQCITPLHLVAYEAHPNYKGLNLNKNQEESALEWLRAINEEFVPPLIALSIEDTDIYPKYMLSFNVCKNTSASKWWKIVAKKNNGTLNPEFCSFMEKISSLPASTASVERLFSSFGFIHNKLRNRLGHEKAEKLVKCYQVLKSDTPADW